MSNPTISQIQIGNTTFDINDHLSTNLLAAQNYFANSNGADASHRYNYPSSGGYLILGPEIGLNFTNLTCTQATRINNTLFSEAVSGHLINNGIGTVQQILFCCGAHIYYKHIDDSNVQLNTDIQAEFSIVEQSNQLTTNTITSSVNQDSWTYGAVNGGVRVHGHTSVGYNITKSLDWLITNGPNRYWYLTFRGSASEHPRVEISTQEMHVNLLVFGKTK